MSEPEREDDMPLDDEHYREDVPEDDPRYWRATHPARKPLHDGENDPED